MILHLPQLRWFIGSFLGCCGVLAELVLVTAKLSAKCQFAYVRFSGLYL